MHPDTHTHTLTCTPTFIHTLRCTPTLTHTLTLTYTHTLNTHMHPDTHTLTCTPTLTHTLTCTLTLTHTHTHSHAPRYSHTHFLATPPSAHLESLWGTVIIPTLQVLDFENCFLQGSLLLCEAPNSPRIRRILHFYQHTTLYDRSFTLPTLCSAAGLQ